MKLRKHLEWLVRKELLKKGRVIEAIRAKALGYGWSDIEKDGITVNLTRGRHCVLKQLPYPASYYKQCHKAGGFHLNHFTSKMRVKRTVYTIYVRNDHEQLVVKTTNEDVYDYLRLQYDAKGFIENGRVRYSDQSIFLSPDSFSGYGMSKEDIWFDNIVAYHQYEDKVWKEPTN